MRWLQAQTGRVFLGDKTMKLLGQFQWRSVNVMNAMKLEKAHSLLHNLKCIVKRTAKSHVLSVMSDRARFTTMFQIESGPDS